MRSTPRSASRRTRRPERRFLLLIVLAALLIGLIVISPKEPTRMAFNVDAEGKVISLHDGLVISEIMSANASALPDENGQFTDWMELWNQGTEDINLKDVTLSNRPDKAKFIFPEHILPPDGRVIVFCDNTNRNDPGRPFHANFKLSSIGTEVYVFDTTGHVLRSLKVPTLNPNEVYALQADGEYIKTPNYSPGFANTPEGHQAYLGQYAVTTGDIVINEIMPAPRSGLRDEDNELSDWVELRNTTDQDYPLDNLALSDNPDRPVKWVFPEGAIIPANGYYVVFCSGKDRVNAQGFPHTNFSLGAEGEIVTLSTRQGQLLDRVQYSLIPADRSWGRDPVNDTWRLFNIGTPGAPNDASGEAQAERFLLSRNPTGVYISEMMSSNDSFPAVPDQPATDWVELHNGTDQVRDLSGHGLSDSLTWPRKWRFPQGAVIYPGEYKVIRLNKSQDAGTNAAQLQANYALKRAGGEEMTFSDPDGNVLDRVIMPEIPLDISYGRTPGQDGFFYYDVPSPGAVNTGGFHGFAARPTLSVAGGLYKENVLVEITAQEGARIRYSLDGSVPTLDKGLDYTGPIEVKDTIALRARAFIPGLQPSQPVTATYVMKTYFTLPVVALVIEPDELWNNETGMLAAGLYEDGRPIDLTAYKTIPFRHPSPTYREHGKVRRPSYAEMFDTQSGKVVFSQGTTMGLIGQYSLDMPQKSFKVVAKAALGTRYFDAPLFADRPFEQYKSFVLRVSGNDAVWTRMVDGVQSRLIDQLPDKHVINQAWQPVIVYLNGQYWGHYNLRERVSRYFVAQHEGIPLEDADNMTIIEGGSTRYYGSNAEWVAFRKKMNESNPATNPEDLQYILDNVDVDSLFDWMALEMFFANTDSGNIRYYRVPGGKWRWIVFDMDYGLFIAANNGVRNILNPKGHGANDDVDNSLFLKILENDQMRDKFLRRFGEIFQFYTTERMLAQVDESYNLLQPEMKLHWERWAPFNLKNIAFDLPQTADGATRYWESRVERLRNVVRKRPRHCWVQAQEWFKLTDQQMVEYFGPKPAFPPEADLNKDDRAIE